MITSSDRGSGMIGTITGITTFLAFLFFAVQLLTNLYATSVVTDVASDGANQAARSVAADRELARIEAEMVDLLGGYGDGADFDWSASTTDEIVLRVQVDNPNLLFSSLGGVLPFTHLDRTVVVRIEQAQ